VAVQQAGATLDTGAWLVELSDRAVFVATGKHRARFLHNFTTCQIKELPEGKSAWGAVTNETGGVVAQALIDAEADAIRLEVARALRDEVLAHLLKYRIADRIDFANRDDLTLLSVVGDAAQATIAAVGLPWGEAEATWQDAMFGATEVRVRRNDFRWDVPSVDLTVPAEHADVLRAALLEAGAKPATSQALTQHRVARGIPVDRVDVDPETMPLEVAYLRPTVDWNKGCYLGQEAICMMEDLGKPRKQLVEVLLDGSDLAASGAAVHNAKGKAVGHITTAVVIDDAVYGLAMVKRKAAKSGTSLTLAGDRTASVVGLAGAVGE